MRAGYREVRTALVSATDNKGCTASEKMLARVNADGQIMGERQLTECDGTGCKSPQKQSETVFAIRIPGSVLVEGEISWELIIDGCEECACLFGCTVRTKVKAYLINRNGERRESCRRDMKRS